MVLLPPSQMYSTLNILCELRISRGGAYPGLSGGVQMQTWVPFKERQNFERAECNMTLEAENGVM